MGTGSGDWMDPVNEEIFVFEHCMGHSVLHEPPRLPVAQPSEIRTTDATGQIILVPRREQAIYLCIQYFIFGFKFYFSSSVGGLTA